MFGRIDGRGIQEGRDMCRYLAAWPAAQTILLSCLASVWERRCWRHPPLLPIRVACLSLLALPLMLSPLGSIKCPTATALLFGLLHRLFTCPGSHGACWAGGPAVDAEACLYVWTPDSSCVHFSSAPAFTLQQFLRMKARPRPLAHNLPSPC